MKKILMGMVILGSLPTFANADFDQMSLNEIYDRGYMLVATVNQEIGIRFPMGEQVVRLDSGATICQIKLRNAPTKDSILKKGSKIKLETTGVGFVGNERDGLYSRSSTTILGIDYHWDSRGPKLENLKRWCDRVSFEVVENDSLEEIKTNFLKD